MKKITFDDFVKYGIEHGGNIHNGMPWSFTYEGFNVTHENDNVYLIPIPGGKTVRFNRNCVLVTDAGHAYCE